MSAFSLLKLLSLVTRNEFWINVALCWKTVCPLFALDNLYTMDCQTNRAKHAYYDNETYPYDSDYFSFINSSHEQP